MKLIDACKGGLLALVLLSGCAQVGGGPPPQNLASANPDRFSFNIAVAGSLAGESTDERARKEIEYYRNHHGYNSYEIVTKTPQGSPPSSVQYEVQFAR
jgi:hypothetical protein